MVKVLVIPHNDVIFGNSASCNLLIKSFSVSELPKLSTNLMVWNQQEPLCYDNDTQSHVLYFGDKYIFLTVASIVRIERSSEGSIIYLENDENVFSPLAINEWENVFEFYNFFLVHPNHLINIMHILSYVQCNAFIKLSNSEIIPVDDSDQKLEKFLNKQTIL